MSPQGLAPLIHAPPGEVVAALADARAKTLALVDGIPDADLDRVHSTLMSPLAWDLGHIAAFEDLWLAHRAAGEPLLRPDLAEVYDAFETPRAHRGDLPYLRARECFEYLAAVRERSLELLERHGTGDGFFHEMVVQHEHQHNETMLQTLALARLDGYRPEPRPLPDAPAGDAGTGLELVEIPGGAFELGAPLHRFSYDNERPRHTVELPPFRIGRTPITNGAFAEFVRRGGYRRREWWSEAGWAWVQETGARRPGAWTDDGGEWHIGGLEALDPARPVVHVSFYEAEAFASSHGLRLPTEAEWEKAATWDPATGQTRAFPWGDAPPDTGRANVDQRGFRPAPAGAYGEGASPAGVLGTIGDVWEWTASELHGYPGFAPHPYPEYSQVFFGAGYRVLRGGSWATCARVATPTFRNWDFPQRRQIFAGFRVATT